MGFRVEEGKVATYCHIYPKDLYVIKTGKEIAFSLKAYGEHPNKIEIFYPTGYWWIPYEKNKELPHVELKIKKYPMTTNRYIDDGYEAYYKLDISRKFPIIGIFKIPANTKFYENGDDEIVSSSLVYIGEFNEKTVRKMTHGQIKVEKIEYSDRDPRIYIENRIIKNLYRKEWEKDIVYEIRENKKKEMYELYKQIKKRKVDEMEEENKKKELFTLQVDVGERKSEGIPVSIKFAGTVWNTFCQTNEEVTELCSDTSNFLKTYFGDTFVTKINKH